VNTELVDRLNAMNIGTLAERMGMVITSARPGRVEATMPVEGNTQPFGLLHGGASAALAETVGSLAAALHAGEERMVAGIELSCTHHRSARSGLVMAVAKPLQEGNLVASYDITITNDDGDRICTARLTCVIRTPRG
jgi:1,4-dihydroxy-2-naphthoyl-CoA hydrolase